MLNPLSKYLVTLPVEFEATHMQLLQIFGEPKTVTEELYEMHILVAALTELSLIPLLCRF